MTCKEVNFRATTSAVLKGFNHSFTEIIIDLLNRYNSVMTASDGRETGKYANISRGYGLLVTVEEDSVDNSPVTIATEFLVPSNELAASYMVMWRRWCRKRNISSADGLFLLVNKVNSDMKKQLAGEDHYSSSNLAIGLMGAVLDNYPETIGSMRWCVNSGFAPCLVIVNDGNVTKCAVCYGGKYRVDEMMH